MAPVANPDSVDLSHDFNVAFASASKVAVKGVYAKSAKKLKEVKVRKRR